MPMLKTRAAQLTGKRYAAEMTGTFVSANRSVAVPTFYFHICDGLGFCEDTEGLDLPDADAARTKAVEGLRDVLAGEMRAGQLNLAAFIEVEDESRKHLFTLSARQVVNITDR